MQDLTVQVDSTADQYLTVAKYLLWSRTVWQKTRRIPPHHLQVGMVFVVGLFGAGLFGVGLLTEVFAYGMRTQG